MGVFLALDLFLFFVFFEFVLVPMYFLIGGWGYDDRVYAAVKFFLFTMVGSAFMLVGILASVFLHRAARRRRSTFDLVDASPTTRASSPADAARWLFLAFAVAFAVKVPLFPLHTWLPDAHTEAPDRGLGDPGRRHAEARHLRLPALRALPVPRGVAVDFAPAARDARRDRHPLRRHRRDDAEAT